MVKIMNEAPTLTPAAIRRKRRQRNWSQADLARLAGLSHPSVVSNVERGLRSPAAAEKIAKALNV